MWDMVITMRLKDQNKKEIKKGKITTNQSNN